ncbi:hypothetical protein PR048_009905 [Dryococelus australis]|uniref:Reverse transcriptase/retrotransposon-derived protein RNase H-like domain-containing protein n=1 Tax=Dryococelus australis TaxID=614101 RepID=A0ABQ9I196_9NEOP|nr:hypothetical protein PR048_009905 [Dryococelus australis]
MGLPPLWLSVHWSCRLSEYDATTERVGASGGTVHKNNPSSSTRIREDLWTHFTPHPASYKEALQAFENHLTHLLPSLSLDKAILVTKQAEMQSQQSWVLQQGGSKALKMNRTQFGAPHIRERMHNSSAEKTTAIGKTASFGFSKSSHFYKPKPQGATHTAVQYQFCGKGLYDHSVCFQVLQLLQAGAQGPGGNDLSVLGFIELQLTYRASSHRSRVYVISNHKTPILGRAGLLQLNIACVDGEKVSPACEYSSRFVSEKSGLLAPLFSVLKTDVEFVWGPPQQVAFGQIKYLLCQAPTVAYFDLNMRVIVSADARSKGLGGCLMQEKGGQHELVGYASRTLSETEKLHSQIEKEAQALA